MKKNIKNKSAQKVAKFLKERKLHKKDFALMIGVTLSYVYNLIDEKLPFTKRVVTIERIATIMDVSPTDFEEYTAPIEQEAESKELKRIKQAIKEYYSSTYDFLLKFKRQNRLEIVDILRGAKPLFIDFDKFCNLTIKTGLFDYDTAFGLWWHTFKKHLRQNGFDTEQEYNKIFINEALNAGYKSLQAKIRA